MLIEKKRTIKYLGKSFTTIIKFCDITDDYMDVLKKQLYEKPSEISVFKQMYKFDQGGRDINKIVTYYLKDIMYKGNYYNSIWTVEEAFNCKEIVEYLYGATKKYSTFLGGDDCPIIVKIKAYLRLGSPVARIPTNFPISMALKIIKKYNTNGNYYDFSCGWATRLLASMKLNINYFGTDPNYLLVDRLKNMYGFYKKVNRADSITDIRCCGSEEFIPEWENKIGLAFSSPPYFDLEDYTVGDQSIKNRNYKEWLDSYWVGTVKNINRYLTDDGNFLLNVKDFGKYKLESDMKKICEDNGFVFIENITLKNIKHPKNDKFEIIMHFKRVL